MSEEVDDHAGDFLAAMNEFDAWTESVLKPTWNLALIDLRVQRMTWDHDRHWPVVGYAGVPDGFVSERGPSYGAVASAIGLMVSIRGRRRKLSGTWQPEPAPKGWVGTIKKHYPSMRCRIEVADGWFDLILALAEFLWLIDGPDDPTKITKIQGKHATMDVDHWSVDERVADLISAFELIGEHACETCGAPGKIRGTQWQVVACDQHWAESTID